MRYGKKWKSYRRLFHEYMSPGHVGEYEDASRRAADSLLVRLEKDPEHYREHTKLLVFHVTSGLDAPTANVFSQACQTRLLWKSRTGWMWNPPIIRYSVAQTKPWTP